MQNVPVDGDLCTLLVSHDEGFASVKRILSMLAKRQSLGFGELLTPEIEVTAMLISFLDPEGPSVSVVCDCRGTMSLPATADFASCEAQLFMV